MCSLCSVVYRAPLGSPTAATYTSTVHSTAQGGSPSPLLPTLAVLVTGTAPQARRASHPLLLGPMTSVPHGVTGCPCHKLPPKDTHVWLGFPLHPKLPPWLGDYINNCLCSCINAERDVGKDNHHSLTLLASESWHSGSCFHFLCTFLHVGFTFKKMNLYFCELFRGKIIARKYNQKTMASQRQGHNF